MFDKIQKKSRLFVFLTVFVDLGTAAKARWNNIRDNYRKSKRRSLNVSGELVSNAKGYKYSEHLKFLDEYFHDRRSVLKKHNNYNHEGVETVDVAYSDDIDNVHISQDTILDGKEFNESEVELSHKRSLPGLGNTSAAKRKQLSQSKITSSLPLMSYFTIDDSESIQDRAVDAFLAGISPTLKSLNPYLLNIAKSKIFNIVQHYEMEMILGQNEGNYRSPVSANNSEFETVEGIEYDIVKEDDS